MISLHVDLGQIIIGVLIATLGWFIRKELVSFNTRLDKHDSMFFELSKVVTKLEAISSFRRIRN